MQKNLIITLVFAIVVAIFSIQNAGPVSLLFFGWEFSTSLVVVVFGAAVLGALIMWIISSFKQLKTKKEMKKLRKEISDLEQEKESLKGEIENLEKKLEHRKEINKVNNKPNSKANNQDNNKDDNKNNSEKEK